MIRQRHLLLAQLKQLMTTSCTLTSQKIVVYKIIDFAMIVNNLECLELNIQIKYVLLQLKKEKRSLKLDDQYLMNN